MIEKILPIQIACEIELLWIGRMILVLRVNGGVGHVTVMGMVQTRFPCHTERMGTLNKIGKDFNGRHFDHDIFCSASESGRRPIARWGTLGIVTKCMFASWGNGCISTAQWIVRVGQ
jgi:hypothetical protein